jgi:hypothetical protein
MFGKQHLFRLSVAAAVASSIAVAGAGSATAGGSYDPSAYVYGGASPAVAQAIQNAGYGGARQVSVEQRRKRLASAKAQSFGLITDTLGGDGQLRLPSAGGGGRAVA